jgi:hypothetical protein
LQVFRANSVVYITVSPQRVQELENLQAYQSTLFLSPPQQVGGKAAPQQVSSAQQADALTGVTTREPTTFDTPPVSTTYSVLPRTSYQFQVNVQTLRQILSALNVTDVTIPDSLGSQPIAVTLPAAVRTQFEGTTPTATLPPGVDMAQLGQAALEVLGMPADQAKDLSKQIDWASTLIFPFPAGVSGIQKVYVNGVTGVLVDTDTNTSNEYMLYWQQGDRFYVLQVTGGGASITGILATANSIK